MCMFAVQVYSNFWVHFRKAPDFTHFGSIADSFSIG